MVKFEERIFGKKHASAVIKTDRRNRGIIDLIYRAWDEQGILVVFSVIFVAMAVVIMESWRGITAIDNRLTFSILQIILLISTSIILVFFISTLFIKPIVLICSLVAIKRGIRMGIPQNAYQVMPEIVFTQVFENVLKMVLLFVGTCLNIHFASAIISQIAFTIFKMELQSSTINILGTLAVILQSVIFYNYKRVFFFLLVSSFLIVCICAQLFMNFNMLPKSLSVLATAGSTIDSTENMGMFNLFTTQITTSALIVYCIYRMFCLKIIKWNSIKFILLGVILAGIYCYTFIPKLVVISLVNGNYLFKKILDPEMYLDSIIFTIFQGIFLSLISPGMMVKASCFLTFFSLPGIMTNNWIVSIIAMLFVNLYNPGNGYTYLSIFFYTFLPLLFVSNGGNILAIIYKLRSHKKVSLAILLILACVVTLCVVMQLYTYVFVGDTLNILVTSVDKLSKNLEKPILVPQTA